VKRLPDGFGNGTGPEGSRQARDTHFAVAQQLAIGNAPDELFEENPGDVLTGAANLRRQIANVRLHGVTPVVAVNAFPTDHPSERQAILDVAADEGVRAAVSTHFTNGGKGAVQLAEAVAEACEEPSQFRHLYDDDLPLAGKIDRVAQHVYGADGIDVAPAAQRQLDAFEHHGYGRLPVCIAKTHLSLSADPALKGAPRGWRLPVREVRASVGAGFIYPICGDMRTMPGLSSAPAAERIDIDEAGQIVGLS
jgi:formate--tetrahydrofolate ligase